MATSKLIRALYVGLKYDYGQPDRGFSYEYLNFFETLRQMERVEVEFFGFDEVMRKEGRTRMNAHLIETVETRKPDICFFVLFTDEIEHRTIRFISEKSNSLTLNWFGDDHWRFRVFSRKYAPYFHWVATTDSSAVEKYQGIGCRNVINTQWGFNPHLYKRFDARQEYDVTFIGQVHSRRRQIVEQMAKAGIEVQCWGRGWAPGRLSHGDMVKMYSRSKINLNFTESSVALGLKPLAKVFINRRADSSISVNGLGQMWDSLSVLRTERRPQIKGRNFEIPGSGGFLLTSNADNLDEYFVPEKEIALFSGIDDLIDKARYYLAHADEREAIRRAGYKRALCDHTYEQRFRQIFEKVGLQP